MTLDLGPWTLDLGPWTFDLGLWTLDFGLWTLDFGLWTLDFGLWNITDVLEFSSTLMEQRTLDARGVLFGWFQMLRGILFFRASRQILAQADA